MHHRRLFLIAALALVAVFSVAIQVGRSSSPAVAQQTDPVELFAVCNNVALTWPNGTSMNTVAAAVSPASAVLSIWRFDNLQQTFKGFAPQFPNQSDLTTANRIDAVFICMSAPGTLNRPLLAPGGGTSTPFAGTTATPFAGTTATPTPAAMTTFSGPPEFVLPPPTSAPRGSAITMSVQTQAGATCSASLFTSSASGVGGMAAGQGSSAVANQSGIAVLTLQVPAMAMTGGAAVRVTCVSQSAGTQSTTATLTII